jgi:hypothetical protein
MEYTALALSRAEAALAELSARIEVVHVRYADIVSPSVTLTCQTICESAGLDYSPLYEAKSVLETTNRPFCTDLICVDLT